MATEGFDGLDELMAGWDVLDVTARHEAEGIVAAAGDRMHARLEAGYPAKEGELRRRVVVERVDPLRVKVRSKAPHAHLYEYGTVQRFLNSTGANRGTMPARPVFVPAAVRTRAEMRTALREMLRRQRVPGMTGVMEVREL